MTHFTSREFNHSISKAKKDALHGPVFVTDRGKPSHVLLSYTQYQQITSENISIVEALSMPGLADIDFEPQKSRIVAQPVDLS
ncbi:type II toxin-antitoxin system Phd/YefM family antitoxin [Cognatishimia activa]|uniref:Antitoxin n=1 Tax=Cognatishimia activa TaxID=1715691 RepID=A0A0P1IVZ8_9RHOB|nr:type II toxin-antitoxin system Phd/YefM family antitoxin [Cognatishimia activa]CUI85249.1 hypothetical protein TA5113_01608 [Cognatishimia activa]CUK25547.1 hypothetical protein TA5114_01348 [Cognatishimia activa]